ncbi:hypothetical protein JST97_33115 [bacterium]|nr:hypothetical protein [bacterium]
MAYSLMIRSMLGRREQTELFFEPLEFFDILKKMLKNKELLKGLLSRKYLTLEEGCEDLGIS